MFLSEYTGFKTPLFNYLNLVSSNTHTTHTVNIQWSVRPFHRSCRLLTFTKALDCDLLNPVSEKHVHKRRRLVQGPISYFMDVKCSGTYFILNQQRPMFYVSFSGCLEIVTIFSHAQTVVICSLCGAVLAYPKGGKSALVDGALPSRFIPSDLLTCCSQVAHTV